MESEPPRRGNRVADWAETLDSESDLAALEARYDQEVAFVDAAIGQLMLALQAMDLRGGPRISDRLLRWNPDQVEGVWNATEETEVPG
jgi:hypothetical protein